MRETCRIGLADNLAFSGLSEDIQKSILEDLMTAMNAKGRVAHDRASQSSRQAASAAIPCTV